MLGSRCALLFLACSIAGCSASASDPAPEAPVWTDAPGTLDVYEGRASDVNVTVRARDPQSVRVEPAAAGGLTVEVLDAADAPADGLFHARVRVRAGYGLSEPSLALDLVEGGARTTIAVALRPHALSWRPLSWPAEAGPPTREHGTFAFDPDARAAFLFHGSGYSPQWKPVEDAWRLDLGTGAWSVWKPTGDVPPAGAARRIAQVPGGKIAYLHGGYTGFESTEATVGDLFRVDLGNADRTFTRLAGDAPATATARNLHALAYDAGGEQLVVYGGFTDTPVQSVLGDTWLVKVTGDRATWTQVKAKSKKPEARYGAFYALDEAARRFIVWSGARMPASEADPVNAADDAWALDLAADPPSWTKLAPAGDAPRGRRNGCVMHDPIGRRLFVFGGTSDGRSSEKGLFVLDLEPGREAWTKLDVTGTPPPRSSGFGFATPDGHVACGFGNDRDAFADVNVLGYF